MRCGRLPSRSDVNNQNAYIEIVKLRHLCGDAPSMWHILVRLVYGCQDVRELRHLCGIFWLGWLMDVGRYEGVTPSMWAFPA